MTNVNVVWELSTENAQLDLETMIVRVTTWSTDPPPITRYDTVVRGYSKQFTNAYYLAKVAGEPIHLIKIDFDTGSCINLTTDNMEKAKYMVASMVLVES